MVITVPHLAYYVGIAIVVVSHIWLLQSLPVLPSAAMLKQHAQLNVVAALLIAFAWFRSCT